MVAEGSVHHATQGLVVSFVVTDFQHSLPVRYEGVLPALFREGQGIVLTGQFDGQKIQATEVLAKHDETYMPPSIEGSTSP
jgi:cytochrome c-type biogenesis protein CcmE